MTGLAFARSSMAHYSIQFSKNNLSDLTFRQRSKKTLDKSALHINTCLTDTFQGQVNSFPLWVLWEKALFS